MVFKNPVTKISYRNELKFIDSLAQSWRQVQLEKQPINEKEQKIIEALDELAGQPAISQGTLTLMGEELLVKVRRSLNASYKKARGEEHPILKLMEQYPFLQELYRLNVEESGQKVSRKLEEFQSSSNGLKKSEFTALRKILDLRIVKKAKPQIFVVERTK